MIADSIDPKDASLVAIVEDKVEGFEGVTPRGVSDDGIAKWAGRQHALVSAPTAPMLCLLLVQ